MNTIYGIYFTGMGSSTPQAEWVNQPIAQPQTYLTTKELPPGPIPDAGNRAQGVGSGFPPNMPMPVFVLDRKLGRTPMLDVCSVGRDIWLISDRARVVLEQVDPSAFVFSPVDMRLKDGGEGPNYWLCDLVRVLDALDEEKSNVLVEIQEGGTLPPGVRVKRAGPNSHQEHVFMAAAIGGHHIFRWMWSPRSVSCDDTFVSAVRGANLTGFGFGVRGHTDGYAHRYREPSHPC